MSTTQATATETVKYTTQLPPELIKWAKRYALDNDISHYEVIQTAVEDFKAKKEHEAPQATQLLDLAA